MGELTDEVPLFARHRQTSRPSQDRGPAETAKTPSEVARPAHVTRFRALAWRIPRSAAQLSGLGLNRANMLPFGSVREATTMPSSRAIGATTILPPSSSAPAAAAATSATWT